MDAFSIGNAWSSGLGFFSRAPGSHAIMLIGVGIIAPAVLQFLLLGGPVMTNPGMMGPGPLGAMAGYGAAMLLVMLASYTLQLGSYFGSLWLGFGEEETLGGAIAYGVLSAVLAVIALGVLIVVFMMIAAQLVQSGPAALLLLLLLAIPLLLLFAGLYTVATAAVAAGMLLTVALVASFGSTMGAIGRGFCVGGGGGGKMVLLAMFVLAALLVWLAARLSCTISAMADRKTLNVRAGFAESWRLTAASQWRIVLYLLLVGGALCLILFVFAFAGGSGAIGGLRSGALPQLRIVTLIIAIIAGIPFAYLTVLVPAGIYRTLAPPASAEIFA
jgi:hypothetical protein